MNLCPRIGLRRQSGGDTKTSSGISCKNFFYLEFNSVSFQSFSTFCNPASFLILSAALLSNIAEEF